MLFMRLIGFFFPLFFYNKLRPIFCSVRNTQYTQCSRNENNMEDDFSVIDPALYWKNSEYTR